MTEIALGRYVNPYNLLSELFFVQNYLGRFWNHTWSLAIEEHFYFGLTALIYISVKFDLISKRRLLTFVFAGLLALPLVLRILNQGNAYSHITHLFPTHLRLDSLLFGVFVAYHFHFRKTQFYSFVTRKRNGLISIAVLFLLPVLFLEINSGLVNSIGLTMLYLAFGITLSFFIVHSNEKFELVFNSLVLREIAIVGKYSYGIYLFHMYIQRYFIKLIERLVLLQLGEKVMFGLYFAASIFAGIVVSKIIERPFLQFRDKIFPSRSASKPNDTIRKYYRGSEK